MEPKTNWGRLLGGILLLAVIYLIWWALNVGSDANYGEIQSNVIRQDTYNGAALSGEVLSGDVATGEVVSGDMIDTDLLDEAAILDNM